MTPAVSIEDILPVACKPTAAFRAGSSLLFFIKSHKWLEMCVELDRPIGVQPTLIPAVPDGVNGFNICLNSPPRPRSSAVSKREY